jgi:hypothetical protein
MINFECQLAHARTHKSRSAETGLWALEIRADTYSIDHFLYDV